MLIMTKASIILNMDAALSHNNNRLFAFSNFWSNGPEVIYDYDERIYKSFCGTQRDDSFIIVRERMYNIYEIQR